MVRVEIPPGYGWDYSEFDATGEARYRFPLAAAVVRLWRGEEMVEVPVPWDLVEDSDRDIWAPLAAEAEKIWLSRGKVD